MKIVVIRLAGKYFKRFAALIHPGRGWNILLINVVFRHHYQFLSHGFQVKPLPRLMPITYGCLQAHSKTAWRMQLTINPEDAHMSVHLTSAINNPIISMRTLFFKWFFIPLLRCNLMKRLGKWMKTMFKCFILPKRLSRVNITEELIKRKVDHWDGITVLSDCFKLNHRRSINT